MPPFDRESLVTTYALYRLEREGIQVRREISNKNRDFQAVIWQKQPDAHLAMMKWLNIGEKSNIKPTWKNLFLILRLIKLDHLVEKMEEYLSVATVKQVPVSSSSTDLDTEKSDRDDNKEKG